MTSDDGGGAALTARRGMAMTKTLDENFYGCYLLRSLHPKHPLSTYIGFTNHPRRRIRQHNGEIKNGAKRTKRKRPWQMIAVVCGFTTKVSALQFEWACTFSFSFILHAPIMQCPSVTYGRPLSILKRATSEKNPRVKGAVHQTRERIHIPARCYVYINKSQPLEHISSRDIYLH